MITPPARPIHWHRTPWLETRRAKNMPRHLSSALRMWACGCCLPGGECCHHEYHEIPVAAHSQHGRTWRFESTQFVARFCHCRFESALSRTFLTSVATRLASCLHERAGRSIACMSVEGAFPSCVKARHAAARGPDAGPRSDTRSGIATLNETMGLWTHFNLTLQDVRGLPPNPKQNATSRGVAGCTTWTEREPVFASSPNERRRGCASMPASRA